MLTDAEVNKRIQAAMVSLRLNFELRYRGMDEHRWCVFEARHGLREVQDRVPMSAVEWSEGAVHSDLQNFLRRLD